MINNFLIINCIGRNDKIGLKVIDKFFIHDFNSEIKEKDQLVTNILNLIKKHKVNLDNDFSILVNSGPGRFSSIRISLAVAKGIKLTKKIKLFGYKDRDLGEGTSLYLQRRYDQQRNVGAQIVTSPREKLNQTQAGYQKDFNMFKSFEGTLTPKQQISPRDFYNEKLVIREDSLEKKRNIPKDWERNPITDRNYYLKSPQLRFSVEHGDFERELY